MRGLVAASLLAGVLAGCKAREGDVCRCAKDCRDGLVCARDATVLADEACFEGDHTGTCIEDESLPDETGSGDTMATFDDLPSRRDLGAGETGETSTDGGTDSTGTDSTGTDATGTDSTGTDSTGTEATGTEATGTEATGTDSTGSTT
jgi:hypothetical protein